MIMIFIIKEKRTNTHTQIQDWLNKLEGSGFRATSPRKSVVEVLAKSKTLMDPIQIFIHAKQECTSLGLVTVYRTLEKLEQLGLIQKVHRPDGCHSYITSSNGHEHLLICEKCNSVEYFSGDDLSELISKTKKAYGFEINNHWLQFFGICPACQKKMSLDEI
jgi:Fur family transcriptional regulator, ferric uptake regulator